MTTQLAAADRVRRFNRFYTRRIGLLDAGHLHTPFSLAEARVLYEVAHLDRPTATTLITTLDLDAGYSEPAAARPAPARPAHGPRRARRSPAARARPHHPRPEGVRRSSTRGPPARLRPCSSVCPGPSGSGCSSPWARWNRCSTMACPRMPARGPSLTLRAPEPGDLGWVVQRHGEIYAEEYGWDESFERLVAKIVGEFAAADVGPDQPLLDRHARRPAGGLASS